MLNSSASPERVHFKEANKGKVANAKLNLNLRSQQPQHEQRTKAGMRKIMERDL